jgi:4-amino-4-deoxy-L-arabinose transferase-like glycosyltransferase
MFKTYPHYLINNKKIIFQKLLIIFFFICIFLIGIMSVSDYGVINDEYTHRLNGFITLNYLGEIFLPEITKKYTFEKNFPSFDNMPDQLRYYGGSVIHAPLGFLEILLEIKDKKNIFLFKHHAYYFIFFLSLIYFFRIIKNRFKNWKYAILSVTIILLTPRIFANSFYNNVDIPFMSFTIFSIYYGLKFLKKPNIKYIILFSLFSAISIDIRLIGAVIPTIIFIIFFFNKIKTQKFKEVIVKLFFVFLLTSFLVFLFWPMLWSNPLNNFFQVILNLANHPINQEVFFFGKNISVDNLPWFYLFAWIFISTPIFYSLLFLIGIFLFVLLFLRRKKKAKINDIDVIFLLGIIIPIFIPIILSSTLYNGWRHFYFVYPLMVYFMIYSISFFFENFKNKKMIIVFNIILFISLADIGYWMIKNHPNQYTFFNKLVRKNAQTNFEIDYMGASYKENLDFLIMYEKKKDISIFNASETKIWHQLFSLKDEDRLKIKEISKNEAEYWITNYWFDKNLYDKKFYDNYKLINEIIVDGIKINSLYKKIKAL